jgi:tryptophanyl-tRNA synthetase
VLKEFGGAQFSKFKMALVELAVENLAPVAANMQRILEDRAYIDKVLGDGAVRAGEIAKEHLRVVKDIVGFFQSRTIL